MIIDEDEYPDNDGVVVEEDDYLAHYGTPRKSGRYPWGSGGQPYQTPGSFLGAVAEMRKGGMKDIEIARAMNMTSSEFRNSVTVGGEQVKTERREKAQKLKDKGWSYTAIGNELGISANTAKNLLKDVEAEKVNIAQKTADTLRKQIDEKKYIDVGKGVDFHLNISYEKLKAAVSVLETEGYKIHYIDVEQLGTGKKTKLKVLAAPGVSWSEVYQNRNNIKLPLAYSRDGGRNFETVLPPLNISSKRVKVRYGDEGGAGMDGVILVRPGVKDTEIGTAHYAQVRIGVDGTHYLKGMALYGDPKDFPPGVDLIFNTNKKNTGNKLDAMKPQKKDDPLDPFGAAIGPEGQISAYRSDGTRHLTSVMNKVNDEGEWDEWSKSLSSQMLSKQSKVLAEKQLKLTQQRKRDELDSIMKLTNPTLKAYLLHKYADSTDAAAVHLKAAHLPRQATKVILPVNSLKPTEVYAPTFRDGERVVLVRFPHGGRFEIPELTVNNRHQEAKKLLGNAPDAIGIHSKVAERLSGADFDGDTVLVIPNNHGMVKHQAPLEELDGFDPQSAYPPHHGMRTMDGGTWNAEKRTVEFPEGVSPSSRTKGLEMGKISNLITDMTTLGAPDDELARAVKHSMVVIDAEKHSLDYKRSARENGIRELVKRYQKTGGGASTIVSRSTAEVRVNERKDRRQSEGGPIDPKTGRKVYVETGNRYPNGELKTQKSTQLAETHNAHDLVSKFNTPIENVYADHSNTLKDLANQARKSTLSIQDLPYSPSANKHFAEEVKQLNAALNVALANAPIERQAMIIGNAKYRMKLEANPDMEDSKKKKIKFKALEEARAITGAKKERIKISPKQWEAIQAGALSPTKVKAIFENADLEEVKKLATPKEALTLSPAKLAQAKALLLGDKYTLAEVADHMGVSVSTLTSNLSGGAS